MNESITKAAGAGHGQELSPERMTELISGAGRVPKQRTCTYGEPSDGQIRKSFDAAPLAPLVLR